MIYSENDVLRVAKRYNNNKRKYLLVNPLQGKHMSVKPSQALEMMNALADKVAQSNVKTKLVIGFAETATAIGAVCAKKFGNNCIYLTTTREDITDYIEFKEEHSHAPGQKLYTKNLNRYINDTNDIVIAEDEISTGNTIKNIITKIRSKFAYARSKRFVVASIINRLTDEKIEEFKQENIEFIYLVRIENRDFEEECKGLRITEPKKPDLKNVPNMRFIYISKTELDARKGIEVGKYNNFWDSEIKRLYNDIVSFLPNSGKILVLGTEEYMIEPLYLAEKIESSGNYDVYFHATTRSPIGISSRENYPINSGYSLHSFYDVDRKTYIYNIASYDAVIVMTDSDAENVLPVYDIACAVKENGCNNFICIKRKKEYYDAGGWNI